LLHQRLSRMASKGLQAPPCRYSPQKSPQFPRGR
jgi:hypothetical protein